MQSSSQLFPVALLSAEFRGDLTEDIYRLKPGNSPDSSVELALTRLGLREGSRGAPVILLHGSFSNRRFWYSPKCLGLGPYLARAGFDVWIPEMRGHGLSPRNHDYDRNRVADYARFDLPAIARFVVEQSAQTPHWIGHSLGGITLAAALGGGYLEEGQAASVALCGSQVSRVYWPLKLPPIAWSSRFLLKRMGGLSGARLKRGPEDEPLGLALETLHWHSLFGSFGEKGNDWWAGLANVRTRVLAVASDGDHQDPAWACNKLLEQFGSEVREYLRLGRRHGFAEDYGHIEMLISKGAQREVWPRLLHWLEHGALPAGQDALAQA
ncbi:alpha/beta fold hydrolase [Pseudomonas sp. MT3]|nr:alpha/beta fold hydrolase [uncultured Pseudomonas sp.]